MEKSGEVPIRSAGRRQTRNAKKCCCARSMTRRGRAGATKRQTAKHENNPFFKAGGTANDIQARQNSTSRATVSPAARTMAGVYIVIRAYINHGDRPPEEQEAITLYRQRKAAGGGTALYMDSRAEETTPKQTTIAARRYTKNHPCKNPN